MLIDAHAHLDRYVDPVGRLLDQTPLFEEAMRSRTLPMMNHKTFYARHGDIFAIGCVFICLIVCIWAFRRRLSRR